MFFPFRKKQKPLFRLGQIVRISSEQTNYLLIENRRWMEVKDGATCEGWRYSGPTIGVVRGELVRRTSTLGFPEGRLESIPGLE